jgi:hypothetical protein
MSDHVCMPISPSLSGSMCRCLCNRLLAEHQLQTLQTNCSTAACLLHTAGINCLLLHLLLLLLHLLLLLLLHLLLLLLQPPELLRYGRMSTNVDIYRWGVHRWSVAFCTACLFVLPICTACDMGA